VLSKIGKTQAYTISAILAVSLAIAQVDVNHLLEPSWPRGEYRNALAEVHRLFNAVRDEHDRLASSSPDAQHFVLQQLSRLRVQRGERLVH